MGTSKGTGKHIGQELEKKGNAPTWCPTKTKFNLDKDQPVAKFKKKKKKRVGFKEWGRKGGRQEKEIGPTTAAF